MNPVNRAYDLRGEFAVSARSAGILLYRMHDERIEVLLAHPGGPYWAKKDLGAWSIPKGEYTDEDPLSAAIREFAEETGFTPAGPFRPLAPVRLSSGKLISAWASEADWDPAGLKSNLFSMEWPPGSGRQQSFPEVDRASWFGLTEAKRRITPGQLPLLVELAAFAAGR